MVAQRVRFARESSAPDWHLSRKAYFYCRLVRLHFNVDTKTGQAVDDELLDYETRGRWAVYQPDENSAETKWHGFATVTICFKPAGAATSSPLIASTHSPPLLRPCRNRWRISSAGVCLQPRLERGATATTMRDLACVSQPADVLHLQTHFSFSSHISQNRSPYEITELALTLEYMKDRKCSICKTNEQACPMHDVRMQ